MSLPCLDEVVLDDLHQWLDAIPFSRIRKSITRDFSDGVLVAEIVAHYLPRYVDLNALMPANATALKKYNWETLNRKVFNKLNFQVPRNLIDDVATCKPGSIEHVLANLRMKIDLAMKNYGKRPTGKYGGNKGQYMQHDSETGSTTNLHCEPGVGGSNLSISSGSSFIENRNGHKGDQSTIAASYAKLHVDDMVPSELLYLAQQRQLEKDECIQAAEARIRHLEQLVAVKDRRIEYLSQRVDLLLQTVSTLEEQANASPSGGNYRLQSTPNGDFEDNFEKDGNLL